MRSELFSKDNLEKESAEPGLRLQNSKLLKAELNGEFLARVGSMVAYQGQVQFEALGSGFVCTAADFLAFMEMLARGGRQAVLGADAVGRMRADQLTDRQRAVAQLFLGEGRSWGLSCEVVLSSDETAVPPGGFGWNGGTGTTAYADPERELAGVLLTHRAMTSNRPMPAFIDFWDAVYRGL